MSKNKRISVNEFANLLQTELGRTTASFDEMKAVSKQHNVNIPSSVWKANKAPGQRGKYDLGPVTPTAQPATPVEATPEAEQPA